MSTPISDLPALRPPDATSNKYSRGKVLVVAGAMAGAAQLCAVAAMRSGAGYVEFAGDGADDGPPWALVRRRWSAASLDDARIGAIAIGPGLEDDEAGRAKLDAVLATEKPAVLDAGALAILAKTRRPDEGQGIRRGGAPATDALTSVRATDIVTVLTPHEGEFERLFGAVGDDRAAAASRAALASRAIVLLKGAVTVIAAPDGRVAAMPPASPWLATAGTGDVLTGIVATMLAQAVWHGVDAFDAVRLAAGIHARAAELAGPGLIADDLLYALKRALTKG